MLQPPGNLEKINCAGQDIFVCAQQIWVIQGHDPSLDPHLRTQPAVYTENYTVSALVGANCASVLPQWAQSFGINWMNVM